MRRVPNYLLVLLCAATVWGCGRWPPIVNSKSDIERLPASEQSIRARGLSDTDIPALARLKDLRILDFYGGWKAMNAKITDQGLKRLSQIDLPHLETLTLGYCTSITDLGLEHVAKMKSLSWLGLTACPNVTDAGLAQLLVMPSLTGLDLRGCSGINDAGLDKLAQKRDWQTICLGGCPNITAGAVARLQAALPNAQVKKDDQEWELHKE